MAEIKLTDPAIPFIETLPADAIIYVVIPGAVNESKKIRKDKLFELVQNSIKPTYSNVLKNGGRAIRSGFGITEEIHEYDLVKENRSEILVYVNYDPELKLDRFKLNAGQFDPGDTLEIFLAGNAGNEVIVKTDANTVLNSGSNYLPGGEITLKIGKFYTFLFVGFDAGNEIWIDISVTVPDVSQVLEVGGRKIKEISAAEYSFIATDRSVSLSLQPNEDLVTVMSLDAGVFPNASQLIFYDNSGGDAYLVAGEGVTVYYNGSDSGGFVTISNMGILTKTSNSEDIWIYVDFMIPAEIPTTDLEYVTNLGGRTPHEVEVYDSADLSNFIKIYPNGSLEAYKGTGFARFSPDRLLISESSGRYLDYYNGRLFLKSRYDGGLLSFDASNLPSGGLLSVAAPNRPGYSTIVLLTDIIINAHPYLVDATGRVDLGNLEEYFIKNTTPTSSITGTTAQTIFYAEKINAGTLKIGSQGFIEFQPLVTGAADGNSSEIYIGNNSTDLSNRIARNSRSSTIKYQPTTRKFQVISATKIRIMQSSVTAANDDVAVVATYEDRDFNINADQWIICTAGLVSGAGTLFGNYLTVKGVR